MDTKDVTKNRIPTTHDYYNLFNPSFFQINFLSHLNTFESLMNVYNTSLEGYQVMRRVFI